MVCILIHDMHILCYMIYVIHFMDYIDVTINYQALHYIGDTFIKYLNALLSFSGSSTNLINT